MKIQQRLLKRRRNSATRSIFRIMKITITLLLIASLHVYANGLSQSRMSLNLQSVNLKEALKQIEKKSQFRFLYNHQILKNVGKVSVQVSNAALDEVMSKLL